MKEILWIVLALSLFSCSKPQPEFDRILHLEDRREKCESLANYLNDPEPRFRVRAIEALGKLQDTTCADRVVRFLSDPNASVRLETAFALGQIGQPSVEKPVIDALRRETVIEVQVRLIEALGKIGGQLSMPVLITLMKEKNSLLRAEAALSAGRLALRNFSHPSLTEALTMALNDVSPEVRWKACYSLMRVGKDLNHAKLREAITDSDARVRMYALQTLGNAQDPAAIEFIGKMLRSDPDWRVRVKAANALGKFPLRRMANYISFSNQTAHVRIALIQAIGSSTLLETDGFVHNSREHNLALRQLEQILESKDERDKGRKGRIDWSSAEIGMALISYAQLLKEDAALRIAEFENHPHPQVRARAMQALGETGSSMAMRVFDDAYSESPAVVKIAILESMSKLRDYTEPQLFVQALQTKDQVLVALAAQGLSQDSLSNKIYAQSIAIAYQSLPKPVDIEAAQMIFNALQTIGDTVVVPALTAALNTPDKSLSQAAAKTLQAITGEDYSSRIASYTEPNEPFHYNDIIALKGARAFIKTNRGNIEILLQTQDAPLTVLNFARLAQKGFFDRLTFHRVVPNFVIQGGDPRGDSWGSPGYSIRSEYNKRPFLRGSVGMASAGKDTEGCQFFITHAEQPHLDGRYTVFGQVFSGMDVVDAVQEGDVMELVTIQK